MHVYFKSSSHVTCQHEDHMTIQLCYIEDIIIIMSGNWQMSRVFKIKLM